MGIKLATGRKTDDSNPIGSRLPTQGSRLSGSSTPACTASMATNVTRDEQKRQSDAGGGRFGVTPSSASSSNSDCSDDVVDDLPEIPTDSQFMRQRHSVSAEVYGEWNKRRTFVCPVHPKTGNQDKRLREVLLTSLMFSHLVDEDLETIVTAFQEVLIRKGDVLINQGDDGDCLYVIEVGEVDVTKIKPGESEAVHLCVMGPGDTVGELALLYNCQRAATVTAMSEQVTLWRLDRETFNHIVKGGAQRRRELYEDFLKEVEILKDMDPYERSKLTDALKRETFEPGATVLRQGDVGNNFYLIEKGSAEAIKDGKVVMRYSRGDYFGELALIRDQPRAATVKATGSQPLVCASLGRQSFKRLLGPVEEILRRNTERYARVAKLMAEESR